MLCKDPNFGSVNNINWSLLDQLKKTIYGGNWIAKVNVILVRARRRRRGESNETSFVVFRGL